MMKMKSTTVKLGLFALTVAVLGSCKKDTEAFPTPTSAGGTTKDFVYGKPSLPSIKDADGILAAVHVHNYRIITVSPVEKEYQYGMAAFTNTTGNFSVLTDGGAVTVDTSALTKGSDLSYQSYPTTYSLNFSSPATWSVGGAGSVPAMTYTSSNGNPSWDVFKLNPLLVSYWKDDWVPTYPKTLTSSSTHNDSVFNVTPFVSIPIKNYVSNCDSVVITWHDNQGFRFEKKFAATDSLATITPNELAGYPVFSYVGDFQMEINAVNYTSQVIGGKKYYFIRMGSYVKYWRSE